MTDQRSPKPTRKPRVVEAEARETTRTEATGPQPYLGGMVQSAAAADAPKRTPRGGNAAVRRALDAVRTLGGQIDGHIIRIPSQYGGTACVDWLSHNGYRIVWV